MASLLNLSLLSSALLLVNGGRPPFPLLDVDPLFPFLIDNLDETLSLSVWPFLFLSCGVLGCWFIEESEGGLLVGLKTMSNNRIDGEREREEREIESD